MRKATELSGSTGRDANPRRLMKKFLMALLRSFGTMNA
jgi:hypothetical protein